LVEQLMLRVGHYINQFFAGIGGEQSANFPPDARQGPVGPGRVLHNGLKGSGAVVSTFICGDSFFNEHTDEARIGVREWLHSMRPDLVVAGPAFAAGRYGVACAEVCRLADEAGIAAVTGMHPENPGVLVFKRAYVVPTGDSATDMLRALGAIVGLGRKMAAGEALGPADIEGYLPRGVRRPGERDQTGAERAAAMLLAKLLGQPFHTEISVEKYEAVPAAPPVPDLRRATIALITTGAIVPRGNPDHLRRCSETRWAKYALAGRPQLNGDEFECVHGGFFNLMASQNPNLVLPLDVLRDLERERAVGRLFDTYFTTTGNDQRLIDCKRNGVEIAAALRSEGVTGVLLVAT
jgi:glycine reductase complex component B subunit gamma